MSGISFSNVRYSNAFVKSVIFAYFHVTFILSNSKKPSFPTRSRVKRASEEAIRLNFIGPKPFLAKLKTYVQQLEPAFPDPLAGYQTDQEITIEHHHLSWNCPDLCAFQ